MYYWNTFFFQFRYTPTQIGVIPGSPISKLSFIPQVYERVLSVASASWRAMETVGNLSYGGRARKGRSALRTVRYGGMCRQTVPGRLTGAFAAAFVSCRLPLFIISIFSSLYSVFFIRLRNRSRIINSRRCRLYI